MSAIKVPLSPWGTYRLGLILEAIDRGASVAELENRFWLTWSHIRDLLHKTGHGNYQARARANGRMET